MDDRVARRLLEDNFLDRLKRAEGNISLLQKLYANGTGEGEGDSDLTIINNTNIGLGAVCFLSEAASDISGYKTMTRTWADVESGTSVESFYTGEGYETLEEFSLPAFDAPVFVNGNFNLDLYLTCSVDQIVYLNAQVYIRDSLGNETLLASRALSTALNESVSNLLFTAPISSGNVFYKVNPTDRFIVKISASVATATAEVAVFFGYEDYPSVFAIPYLSSGDVISDETSSVVGNVPIFSDTSGKHIGNSEVQISHLTYSSQALFHLSNTASDISGYKTLTEIWGEVASGTSSAACAASAGMELIEEFISPELESPTFFVGAVHLGFYLSADADGGAEAQYAIFIRDAAGTETLICDGNDVFSLTATPTAILFLYGLGIDNNIIINPTDRMVLKVSVNVSVDSAVTLQIGSATYPAYVIAPTYKQSLGDMRKSVYDPTNIGASAFDTDNHIDGATNGVYTLAERSKLAGIEAGAEVNNISDANVTDLTDGGATTLHSHAGGGSFLPQGAWSGATAYVEDDLVTINGSSYVCVLAHTNQTPPNATYWQLIASKGDAGTAGVNGGASIVLFDHYADAGNGTTAETDLYSDTLAAGQLVNNGDKIQADYSGVYVSSATATRQIKLKFAGTTIFDTGALTLSLSSAWELEVLIIRVSSTVIRYSISFATQGAALSAYTASGELTGLTLSNTNILKITGQAAGVGAATNDIVAKLGTVLFIKLTDVSQLFNDAEGDPADVNPTTPGDGTSTYAARRDHVHKDAAEDWELIEDIYLSSADATNFDFQSIPSTYKHLKIVFDGRSDKSASPSDGVKIKFNNDAGNNYVGLVQWGAGQVEQATAGAPTVFSYVTASTSPANWFSNSEITIFDYASTSKYHGWQARGMQAITNSAGNFFIYDAMGLYLSTTAISRITLFPQVGSNFKRYSRATLYGIK